MWRAGALTSDILNKGDDFRDVVIDKISPDVQFHDDILPPSRPTVFTDDLPADNRKFSVRRVAGTNDRPGSTGLARWTRSVLDVDSHTAVQVLKVIHAAWLGQGCAMLRRAGRSTFA